MASLLKLKLKLMLAIFLLPPPLLIYGFQSQRLPVCKSVFLACNSIANSSQSLPPSCSSLPNTPNMFRKADVFVGGHITPPTPQHEDPFEAFLPTDSPHQFSLKDESAHVWLDALSSPLAQHMQKSLCSCGKEVASSIELKICPTSVVGMMELATLEPGSHHIDILETVKRVESIPETDMTVTNVALRRSRSMKTSIVCKEMAVASGRVSICYAVEGVENIEATMRSSDGEEEITAGMQCYKVEDRRGERWCHWVSEDTLVGLLKTHEEENEQEQEEEEGEGMEWIQGMKFSLDFDHVGDAIKDTANKAKEAVENTVQKVENGTTQATNTVVDKANDTKNALVNTTTKFTTEVVDTAGDAKTKLVNGFTHAKDVVVDKAFDLKKAVVKSAINTKDAIVTKSNDFKNAVVDKAHDVKNAVVDSDDKKDEELDKGSDVKTRAVVKGSDVNNTVVDNGPDARLPMVDELTNARITKLPT